MPVHIRVVYPGKNTTFRTQESLSFFESFGFKIDIRYAQVGPETISNRCEEAFSVPGTLQQIVRAEKEGVDAVVIDCMGDPGVEEGRELVSIPVVGPSRTAMHVASTLGEHFAVVTVEKLVISLIKQQAKLCNLELRLSDVSSIDIPPALLQCDLEHTVEAICEKALQAVSIHAADTIIFGCSVMMGCVEKVKKYLLKEGYDVPVIDPLPLAIHYARMLVDAKLSHGKQLYGRQILKAFPGYEFLE